MNRRRSLSCLAAACIAVCTAACRGAEAGIGEPPALLGGRTWERRTVERPPLDGVPDALKRYQPKEWLRAEYAKGESVVRVDMFRMPGEPSAFEARQKWLGQPGTASINHGSLFVLAASSTEPARGLGEFLRLMEAEWLSVLSR